jgi:hypothetical protein
MPAKLQLSSTFPASLVIDGFELAVRVARLTNDQFDAYAAAFSRWDEPRGSEPEAPEAKAAREAEIEAWMRASLRDYLTVDSDQLSIDGASVTHGERLFELFRNREDVVPQALCVILFENRLSEAQKKTYKSLLDFRFGLRSAPPLTATGSAPAPTADVAEPSGSAAAAGATAEASRESSGTTDPSC